MKKILITGCQGFIGSNLVKELLKKNKIIGIDDLSSSNINLKLKSKNFKFLKGECQNDKILNKIKGNVDVIYHLAGQSSGEKSYNDTLIDFEKNSLTTIKLLEFALKKKCKRFIYASSMSVYGNLKKGVETDICNPISFYGLSKLTSENYIKKFKKKGLDFTICRLFNVIGEEQKLNNLKQGMLRIYLTQLKKNNKLVIKGSKYRYRDFINIKDIINILIKIYKNNKCKNQIINLGTGKKTYIFELVELLKKNIEKNFSTKFIKGTPDDQFGIIASTKKMKQIFKYKFLYSEKHNIEKIIKNVKL